MSQQAFLPGAEQFYTAAQNRQNSLRGMTQSERLIERANNVSIFDVLQDFFGIWVPREGRSYKAKCPFADEHADGGLDKGWRTYPATNSSMCFPMHGFMTPTRLIQIKYNDRYAATAATRILKNYDLLRPAHWKDRYAELVTSLEHQGNVGVGNPVHAVEALSVALKAEPNYVRRQFDADVMDAMEKVLDHLDRAVETGNPEVIRKWYMAAKEAMTKVVRSRT